MSGVSVYSTGITVTWNSTTFQGVNALAWQYGGTRQDRGSAASQGWTDSPGSITFTCLGDAGITTADFGKRGAVTVTGGGMAFSGNAIFESLQADAELNGVTRYSVSLKIHT